MNILMAVTACITDLPEFPAVIFPVTVEAGNGLVSPIQFKGRTVVPLDGEQGGGESLFGMALQAVRCG
jgi:hypothetical protein